MKKPHRRITWAHVVITLLVSVLPFIQGVHAIAHEHYQEYSSHFGFFILKGKKAVLHGWGYVFASISLVLAACGAKAKEEHRRTYGAAVLICMLVALCLMLGTIPPKQ